MKDSRHIIWSNDIDYDDWREDLEEQYPDLTETERMELMYEMNGDYLDDKRSNLDIQLSRPILVVGDLGLWHGRRMDTRQSIDSDLLTAELVDAFCKTLTDNQRSIFWDCLVEGKSQSAYAAEHAISGPTVNKQIRAIRKKAKIYFF